MTKIEKSAGQVLLERMVSFVERYIHFGVIRGTQGGARGQAVVVALWAIHTWLSDKFFSTPFLHVSAASTECGKSMCLELLQLIVRVGKLRATVRPLEVARTIEAFEGRVTFLLDQMERFASDRQTEELTLLATGERQGQTHAISMGGESKEFRVFAPRAFASIGDLTGVLRSRSIPVYLERGKPEADFYAERGAAEDAAAGIVGEILQTWKRHDPALVLPDFLHGRDREIWSALWSIALDMNLDAATMKTLRGAMVDLSESKKLEPRAAFCRDAERDANEGGHAERLVRDIQSVLQPEEKRIGSMQLLDRLLALDVAPWRSYKGGLTALEMASLLKRFGLYPTQRRIKVGRVFGYDADAIRLVKV